MDNKDTDLTFKDCSYYTCRSSGDWSQSVCNITGKLCDADEAGLACSMWEEEKVEILKERRIAGEKLDCGDAVYKGNDGLYYKVNPDVQSDTSSQSS